MRAPHTNSRGFTLIELLIAVTLAALLLVATSGLVRNALGTDALGREVVVSANAIGARPELGGVAGWSTAGGDVTVIGAIEVARFGTDAGANSARLDNRVTGETTGQLRLIQTAIGSRSAQAGSEGTSESILERFGRHESLSVTAFRTYLECPYLFWLRHVARLRRHDDRAQELDALGFGNLVHEVLAEFGTSDVRDLSEADDIAHFLSTALDRRVERLLGQSPRAAVFVQTEHLRARLEAFARWQASHRRAGWRIHRLKLTITWSQTG